VAKTSKTKQSAASFDAGLPGLAGMMTALNPVASKAVIDMMTHGTTFMTERVTSAMALQQDLMSCRSPVEAMELQAAFARETMTACTAEMTRAATLMSESFGAVAQDARTGHKRGYDDVPV
jgi:hypothetical protein